jgi:hypothetical protein
MSPDSIHEHMVKIQLPEGTFRAADIVTTKRPEAVDIEKHLKYSKRVDWNSGPSGQKQWRIFACAAAPMRASAWQKLFHANKVKKIEGNFKDYQWFKQCVDTPGVVIPAGSVPPGGAEHASKKHRPREDEDLEGLSELELKKQRLNEEYEERMRLLEEMDAEADPMEEDSEPELDNEDNEADPMEAAEAESADAKPVGPTWMQCALEGKCSKCDFISRWERGDSKWRQKLEYVAWTQPRNAEGKLTGFVEIMALAKAPMAIEEWQKLFHCRRAMGLADTEDLGALVDRARADGGVWSEKGVRARGLADGRWVGETEEELEKRMQAEGRRYWKERGDAMDAFRAQQRAQRAAEEAEANAAAAAAKAAAEAASAALAARATLAVRAAWGKA